MQSRTLNTLAIAGICLQFVFRADADELRALSLPPPHTQGGRPLMETLRARQTTREFKPDKLSSQVLSDLLWAAFGINRLPTGQRTAPSAMNSQEIDIYVATPAGLFLYDAKAPQLMPITDQDVRAKAGGQDSFKQAPLTLIYVADLPRLSKAKPDTRSFYADFDAGCICQNVYLFCASEGLATVVHDLDRVPLAAAMKLRPEQQIIFVQPVGFSKNSSPAGPL